MLGSPVGRFYDCGENREGKGYRNVTDSDDPVVVEARKEFAKILDRFPPVQKDHPHFTTRAGKRFLEAYTKPEAIQKHLHNHRDFEYSM